MDLYGLGAILDAPKMVGEMLSVFKVEQRWAHFRFDLLWLNGRFLVAMISRESFRSKKLIIMTKWSLMFGCHTQSTISFVINILSYAEHVSLHFKLQIQWRSTKIVTSSPLTRSISIHSLPTQSHTSLFRLVRRWKAWIKRKQSRRWQIHLRASRVALISRLISDRPFLLNSTGFPFSVFSEALI